MEEEAYLPKGIFRSLTIATMI